MLFVHCSPLSNFQSLYKFTLNIFRHTPSSAITDCRGWKLTLSKCSHFWQNWIILPSKVSCIGKTQLFSFPTTARVSAMSAELIKEVYFSPRENGWKRSKIIISLNLAIDLPQTVTEWKDLILNTISNVSAASSCMAIISSDRCHGGWKWFRVSTHRPSTKTVIHSNFWITVTVFS